MVVEPLGDRASQLIKDVIYDVTPSFTHLLNNTVSSIKIVINNIPEDFEVTADVAAGFVKDIGADKVEFRFKKPESIEFGGSYSIGCIVRPDINVDLL